MSNCDFNKVANWNHTSAWVFSCKFAAYFKNNFSYEHLWMTASVNKKTRETINITGVERAIWILFYLHLLLKKLLKYFFSYIVSVLNELYIHN